MTEASKWSVVVLDDGSPHLLAFDELAAGVHSALVDLQTNADETVLWGVSARLRETARGRWIVFGAMRQPWTPLPYDAVIYNTEQRGSPWLNDAVLALYRRHVVWDYSAVNAEALRALGATVVHVPFCWYQGIECAQPREPQFDVIHIGTLNERRVQVLDELRARGLNVYGVTGLYGSIRDGLLASSKVIVNIHFYGEDGVHEAARVVYAAANHVAVVSERSAGGETTPGIVECAYVELADEVERLVRDDARRATVVEEQYAGVCGLAPRMATRVAAADRESTVLGPIVVLSMVSCDEPATIERALLSARPYVHAWCVSYNGVGQETRDRILAVMEGVPGEIIDRPWVSYGHNRTEALRLAEEWGTHALILDADEIIERGPDLVRLPVDQDCDGWECSEIQGEIWSPKIRLVRLSDRWRYAGAVHELLRYDGQPLIGALPELHIRNARDGAGSRVAAADRYHAEAAMLRAEVETTGDPRAQFYLAQSLDCAGDWQEAAIEYARRADMSGGFGEEAWMSLVRIGAIYTRVVGAESLVPDAFLRAYQARPTRAEPMLYLARWYRARGDAHVGLLFARRAAGMEVPEGDRLFVERSAHSGGWQALDELALCLGATGAVLRAIPICEAALAVAPEAERERLLKNLDFFKSLGAAKV